MFCFVSFMRALVCLALLTIRIRLSRPLEDTLEAVTDTFDTEASDEKQYRLVTCVIFVMNGLEESFHFEVPGLNCRNCFGSLESFLASFTPFENRQRNASRPYRTSFGRENIGNEPFANLKKDVIKRYQNINMIKALYSFEYVQVACAVVYCSKPMHLTHTQDCQRVFQVPFWLYTWTRFHQLLKPVSNQFRKPRLPCFSSAEDGSPFDAAKWEQDLQQCIALLRQPYAFHRYQFAIDTNHSVCRRNHQGRKTEDRAVAELPRRTYPGSVFSRRWHARFHANHTKLQRIHSVVKLSEIDSQHFLASWSIISIHKLQTRMTRAIAWVFQELGRKKSMDASKDSV